MGRGLAPRGQPSAPPGPLMTKDAQVRFVAIALALLTITAAVFAWINFQKERQFETPYDGVWWVEKAGHVQAKRIDADGQVPAPESKRATCSPPSTITTCRM